MVKMIASISTWEKLVLPTVAKDVLNGTLQNGSVPEKVGLYEPVRQPFTEEDFIDM